MALNDLPRTSRTLLTAIGLSALYLLYSQITRPMLTVNRSPQIARAQPAVPEKSSPIFATSANRWLPQHQWVSKANSRFRDGSRLLFFDEHELLNENRAIRVSPVAMVWQGEGESQGEGEGESPITAVAESASFTCSAPLSLGAGQFGRITSGLLGGEVRIEGPQGLRIEGRTFYFEEESLRIWSSEPVRFGWEQHTGTAEGGVEIELSGAANPQEGGLMSVSDIRRIRLLGRVNCSLQFTEKDSSDRPVQLHVSAANGFEYYVPTLECTFTGFVDRELRPDNQVLVEQPQEDGSRDRLFCSRLLLQLRRRERDPGERGGSQQLAAVSIAADGRRVLFRSEYRQITAAMSRLVYQIEERRLDLTGRPLSPAGPAAPVTVEHAGRRLTAPAVAAVLDGRNQVRLLQCSGPGRIDPPELAAGQAVDEKVDRESVSAKWSTSLQLTRAEQDVLVLTGQAEVGWRPQRLSLAAAEIALTMYGATDRGTEEVAAGDGKLPLLRGPRQLRATGDVRLDSPQLTGGAKESLLVEFEPEDVSSGGQSATSGEAASAGLPTTPLASGGSGTTQFFCDAVETKLRMSSSGRVRFEDLWLRGAVAVTHRGERKSENFTAEGKSLHAAAGFDGSRRIMLFGEPASVTRVSDRIDGPRIDLNELISPMQAARREAEVRGSGRIRFVVERGLDGKLLERPTPLDIYWNEKMSFAERTARFTGNVRAVLDNETDFDVELTCAGMLVHFGEAVRVEQPVAGREIEVVSAVVDESSEQRRPSIERIECEGRVQVQAKMMTAGVVTARHFAEFADFEFEYGTGQFRGTGPGYIETVQPDSSGRLAVSRAAVARANTPVSEPDQAFIYVRATFIGTLDGSQQARFVRLRQHVRGVFGPVRSLDEKISLERVSVAELPDQTGLMGCENLTVSLSAGGGSAGGDGRSFSLVAESNAAGGGTGTRAPCRLESRLFSGDADKITYDHAKQQYILRAEEGRQAKVTYLPHNGQPQVLTGRRFEYYSDRNYLNANQITGVQTSGGL
ncbi:MAG: hypothetical protein ACK5KS_15680 [Planctomyces sp.]